MWIPVILQGLRSPDEHLRHRVSLYAVPVPLALDPPSVLPLLQQVVQLQPGQHAASDSQVHPPPSLTFLSAPPPPPPLPPQHSALSAWTACCLASKPYASFPHLSPLHVPSPLIAATLQPGQHAASDSQAFPPPHPSETPQTPPPALTSPLNPRPVPRPYSVLPLCVEHHQTLYRDAEDRLTLDS